jgi:hypothetical protein
MRSLALLKIAPIIFFRMVIDTLKQFPLVGSVLINDGLNSITIGSAKRMKIVWVVTVFFGTLMAYGSNDLCAILEFVML